VLWLSRGPSPLGFVAAATGGSVVFVLLVYKLGTFSAEEVAMGREALGFFKPLLAKWRGPREYKAT
jgi:hypothetical protein